MKTNFLETKFFFLALISLIILQTQAFAADDQPALGIVTIFCNVIGQITGGVGKVISILIVISMAIGLFLGKITWGLAIAVMVGMGLLFGASNIVDAMADGTSTQTNVCGKKKV